MKICFCKLLSLSKHLIAVKHRNRKWDISFVCQRERESVRVGFDIGRSWSSQFCWMTPVTCLTLYPPYMQVARWSEHVYQLHWPVQLMGCRLTVQKFLFVLVDGWRPVHLINALDFTWPSKWKQKRPFLYLLANFLQGILFGGPFS